MFRGILKGLFLFVILTFPFKVNAAGVDLNIGVNLVKCGETRADIPKACRADSRCCVFMDNSEGPQIYDLNESFELSSISQAQSHLSALRGEVSWNKYYE